MRVEGTDPALAAIAAALRREAKVAQSFAPEPVVPTTPAAATSAAMIGAPATSVAMLVALAAVDTPAERRRRAIEHSDRGLTLLERLRAGLAAGAVAPEQVRELTDWTGGLVVPDDPVLAEIARDIELRVRVELAKLDRRV